MRFIEYKALFLTCFLLGNFSFGSHNEDVRSAQSLFNLVDSELNNKLDREDAPEAYRKACQTWNEKKPIIWEEIQQEPRNIDNLISIVLEETGLSHLGFNRLKDNGFFGFDSEPLGDSTEKVTRVYPKTPAEEADIQVDDIVISIAGECASNKVRSVPVGTSFKLELKRLEREWSASIKTIDKDTIDNGVLGLQGEYIEDDIYKITYVNPDSPAARAGLRKKDRILSVDGIVMMKTRSYRPGEESTLLIQKASGEKEEIRITRVASIDYQRDSVRELDFHGKKVTYLHVASFSEEYQPEAVHKAFESAEKNQALIVDLRQNGGGRSEHLLAFLLGAHSYVMQEIGKNIENKDKDFTEGMNDCLSIIRNGLDVFLGSKGKSDLINLASASSELNGLRDNYFPIRNQLCETCLKGTTNLTTIGHGFCDRVATYKIKLFLKRLRNSINSVPYFLIGSYYDRYEEIRNILANRKRAFKTLSEAILLDCDTLSEQQGMDKFTQLSMEFFNTVPCSEWYNFTSYKNSLEGLRTSIKSAERNVKSYEQYKNSGNDYFKQQLGKAETKFEELTKSLEKLLFQVGIEEQTLELRRKLFDRHFCLLKDWYEETQRQIKAFADKPLGPSVSECRIPDTLEAFQSIYCWGPKVKRMPFPYSGKVAFLVGKGTFCAAEICAIAPMEYLELRKVKEINKIRYADELFVEDAIVIGKTLGGAQGLETKEFATDFGTYRLSFPMYDVYTPIHHHKIEGYGIKGVSVQKDAQADAEFEPKLRQALDWLTNVGTAPGTGSQQRQN